MGTTTLLLSLFLLCHAFHRCASQGAPNAKGPKSLAQQITPSVVPPNEALFSQFPAGIFFAQTPIGVRYSMFTVLPSYEVMAACHPIALSFFGTKDPIPSAFCKSEDTKAILYSLITHRLIASEFPAEARSYGSFLIKAGLKLSGSETDKKTVTGWANHIASRFIKYFSSDGWNSQGDATRTDFRQRFSDSSGYKPKNLAGLAASALKRPLRWQPLTVEADSRGNFISQVHVTPHIGTRGKPLVLTPQEMKSRIVPGPYVTPTRRSSLSPKDKRRVISLIRNMFRVSSKLTNEQIAVAFWWENKFVSLGSVRSYYKLVLNIEFELERALALGDLMSQHDAVLLAWKEKVRHDLVRPKTIVRRLLSGVMVKAFKGVGKGIGMVKAEEWEPLVPNQPHSEYPSASATLCTASTELVQNALEMIVGKNGTIPPFQTTLNALTNPTSPVRGPVKIKLKSPFEVGRNCGWSRLLAGVHFGPSVTDGQKLATGLGVQALEHAMALFNGKVPDNCARCISE